jgi:predicted transposase/invertase (TIGR01784 family)
LEKGREEGKIEIARNALSAGLPVEMVQQITGLDFETIEWLYRGDDS